MSTIRWTLTVAFVLTLAGCAALDAAGVTVPITNPARGQTYEFRT